MQIVRMVDLCWFQLSEIVRVSFSCFWYAFAVHWKSFPNVDLVSKIRGEGPIAKVFFPKATCRHGRHRSPSCSVEPPTGTWNKAGHPVNSWYFRWLEFDWNLSLGVPKIFWKFQEGWKFWKPIVQFENEASRAPVQHWFVRLQDFYSPFQTFSPSCQSFQVVILELCQDPGNHWKSNQVQMQNPSLTLFPQFSTIQLSFPASIGQLHCHRRWKEFRPVTKNYDVKMKQNLLGEATPNAEETNNYLSWNCSVAKILSMQGIRLVGIVEVFLDLARAGEIPWWGEMVCG